MLLRRVTLLLFAVVLVTACDAAAGSAPDTQLTVPVGDLPAPVTPPATGDTEAPSTVHRSTTTLAPEQQVGAKAPGNRIILIGDSVMASTSRRYSNDMCNALVPLGWQVELDAEVSRFIQFGNTVLDKRLKAGWDVGVILLGNNYGGDQAAYRTQLEKMITRLSPNPVVLLTVTEFTPSRTEVNDVIREMAAKYPNVHLVDWAASTADDPGFVGADGLHLTPRGREGLATNVAFALGQAPESPGKCLGTDFHDDSAGSVTGTTARPGSVTPTTKKPSTGSTTTDTIETGSVGSTSVAPTVTTPAPVTTPATTVKSATTVPPAATPAPTTTAAAASKGPVPPVDTVPPVPAP